MTTPDQRLQISESRDSFSWGQHLNPHRLEASLAVINGPVLDVGCSSGAYVRAFRARGLTAYGVDVLPPSGKKPWRGGWYVVGKIEEIPFPSNIFDTVTCFEVLEHLDDPVRGLRELVRVTHDHVVLSVPDAQRLPEHEISGLTYHHWLDRTHVSTFTQESLGCLLEKVGLEVERLEGINRVTPEVLMLAQYHLPKRVQAFLLRLLKRIPGRTPRTMTLLAVARRSGIS